MELTNLTVNEFIQTTASGEPVPGGGSISALCGALSAALAEMVTHLTIGKKKYAKVEEQMEHLVKKTATARDILEGYIEEDSEAYDMVFKAYKLPKKDEIEIAKRLVAIQKALKHAAEVPLGVAQTAGLLFPMLKQIAKHGNSNAITDVYVATLCARTAVLGACANVRINLLSITDPTFVESMLALVAHLEKEADSAEKEISETVKAKM